MKPKVLFVVNGFGLGGIETYIKRFLEYSHKELDISILSKTGKTGYYENIYKELDAKIVLINVGFYNIRGFYLLYKHLHQNHYSTVCDFTGTFSGPILFLAKINKIKNRLCFFRGSQYQFRSNALKQLYLYLCKILLKISATKILSNSKTALNNFFPGWEKKMKNTKVIYNGVSRNAKPQEVELTRRQFLIPEKSFVIGHIGNYRPVKNHKLILETARVLCKKYSEVVFILFGENVAKSLSKTISKFQLETKIITPGVCSNPFNAHKLMDAFIYPSLNEGQPNALLEALYSGIPVVASNIPSIRECTPPKMKEALLDPNNPNKFVEKLELLINNESLYSPVEVMVSIKKIFDPDKNFKEFQKELKK